MEYTVRLDEVGSRLGQGTTEHAINWCHRLKVQPRPDWAGRLALTTSDAARIVDAYDRAEAEQAELRARHDQYLHARAQARAAFGEQAFRDALEKGRKSDRVSIAASVGDEYAYLGLPTGELSASPEVATAAYRAQAKELDKWDKKHPELDVSTFKSKGPNV